MDYNKYWQDQVNKAQKKKKGRKKKEDPAIRFKEARRALKKMPDKSRAYDTMRTAKNIRPTPTKAWAKNPTKWDVKGLDDGSKQVKLHHKKEIHNEMSPKGRLGANKTNAKRANKELVRDTEEIKRQIKWRKEATTEAERKSRENKIQQLKDRMIKNQKLIARWQKGGLT